MASYTTSIAINAVVKLTACIYRPWIRDSRILPAGDAITTATGYSFPSGHTTTAAPIYGGLSISVWRKMRWISILCVVFLLLTGFSRNYLGVHTPQDVAVGLTEGVLVLWGMSKLFAYLSRNPEKENLFLIAGVIFGIAALIYISIKSYPMDYVDGKLLVDPVKMMRDGYGDIGAMMALCIGRYIEKTWIRFKPSCSKRNVATGLVGAVIAFCLIQMLPSPMRALFCLHWGCFVEKSTVILFIIAIWPAVMKATMHEETTGAAIEEA